MNIQSIITATAAVALTGIIIAVFLSIAEKIFYVKTDEREQKIRDCLASNNCGACGYAGCDALAKAILNGEAPVNACPPAGQEGADKIAAVMGVNSVKAVAKTAYAACNGTACNRHENYKYFGIDSCRDIKYALGGTSISCSYGCLGYGDCVNVCPYGAISVQNSAAVIDESLCAACSKCVKTCPQDIINIVESAAKVRVLCKNTQRGKSVKDVCSVGCIACGLCVKNCPKSAVKLVNNTPVIDYDKCIFCTICAQKCPTGAIAVIN